MNTGSATISKADGIETLPTPHSRLTSYFRYDEKGLRLEVGFKYGAVKQHWPIYKQTWTDLKLAPSKGRFYLQAIKKTNPGNFIKR